MAKIFARPFNTRMHRHMLSAHDRLRDMHMFMEDMAYIARGVVSVVSMREIADRCQALRSAKIQTQRYAQEFVK